MAEAVYLFLKASFSGLEKTKHLLSSSARSSLTGGYLSMNSLYETEHILSVHLTFIYLEPSYRLKVPEDLIE